MAASISDLEAEIARLNSLLTEEQQRSAEDRKRAAELLTEEQQRSAEDRKRAAEDRKRAAAAERRAADAERKAEEERRRALAYRNRADAAERKAKNQMRERGKEFASFIGTMMSYGRTQFNSLYFKLLGFVTVEGFWTCGVLKSAGCLRT